MHTGSVLDALRQRMTAGEVTYAIGYDIEGDRRARTGARAATDAGERWRPTQENTIEFTGARALPAGSTWTWTGHDHGAVDRRLRS